MLIQAEALVLAPERILRPGRLRVSGRTIREVGSDLRPEAGEEILELPRLTLAPGFLNLHAHLELAPLHGKIRPGVGFAEWLRQLLLLLPGLHSTARTASILESSRNAAETGTTTLLSILTDPAALAGLAGTLPRIWWAREFMDLHGNPQPAQAMDQLAAWLSRHPGCDWHAAISPHAPFTASSKLYGECVRLASELRIPFTTHWAETLDEEELFASGGGSLRPLLPDSWSSGLLSERSQSFPQGSLLVHGNRIPERQMAGFARRGCFVIHCPCAHAWFGREDFHARSFLQNRIPVALGTDSPACSENHLFDLRVEARAFRRAHPEVSCSEVWSMLTTIPAKSLGQEGRLGCLAAGAEADWVAWRLDSSADPVPAILESNEKAEILSVAGRLHRPEIL